MLPSSGSERRLLEESELDWMKKSVTVYRKNAIIHILLVKKMDRMDQNRI